MPNPLAAAFKVTVTIYPATKTQDRAGGPGYVYTTTPRTMTCSVQPWRNREEFGQDGRLTEYRQWRVFTFTNPSVNIRDKLTFTLNGAASTAYVQSSTNMGGVDVMFRIICVERL